METPWVVVTWTKDGVAVTREMTRAKANKVMALIGESLSPTATVEAMTKERYLSRYVRPLVAS